MTARWGDPQSALEDQIADLERDCYAPIEREVAKGELRAVQERLADLSVELTGSYQLAVPPQEG